MILLTGGTGFIGRALVRQLVGGGRPVNMLLRPSPRTPNLPLGVPVEAAVCSLSDERGLRAAMLSGRETSRMVLGFMDGTDVVLVTSMEIPNEISMESERMAQPVITETKSDVHAITLKAAGSGREVVLNGIGKPAVLIFHTQETAETAEQINKTIRAESQYENCETTLIANVVDLRAVPKLFRSFAERSMRESHEKSATVLAKGLAPQDYVVILPDWDGSVTKAFVLANNRK